MNSQNRRTAGRVFAVTAALVLAFAPALAEARAGKGFSSGSRGARTESAPPRTNTAPAPAQSFQRSNPAQSTPAPGVNRPAAPAQAAGAAGGMFSSPLARGIMGGLIGAGIVGLLMGSGLFSGLGSLAGILGLMLQLALIGGLVWLAMAWWRRRQQPQTAAPMGYDRANDGPPAPSHEPQTSAPRSALGGLGGGLGGAGLGAGAAATGSAFGTQTRPLKVDGPDFERFEKILEEVQGAFSQEDLGHLRRISTPEMAGYFEEDIAEQQAKGVISKTGGVKLLQGDLSEAWSEASGEYATVAMRYELFDAVLDRDTGKVVEGDLTTPQEVTEIWTFVRAHNAGPQGWTLSAIQQVEDAAE